MYLFLSLVENTGHQTKTRFLEIQHSSSPRALVPHRARRSASVASGCRVQFCLTDMPRGAPTGDGGAGCCPTRGPAGGTAGCRLTSQGLELVRLCDALSGGERPGPAFQRSESDLPSFLACFSRAQFREGLASLLQKCPRRRARERRPCFLQTLVVRPQAPRPAGHGGDFRGWRAARSGTSTPTCRLISVVIGASLTLVDFYTRSIRS